MEIVALVTFLAVMAGLVSQVAAAVFWGFLAKDDSFMAPFLFMWLFCFVFYTMLLLDLGGRLW